MPYVLFTRILLKQADICALPADVIATADQHLSCLQYPKPPSAISCRTVLIFLTSTTLRLDNVMDKPQARVTQGWHNVRIILGTASLESFNKYERTHYTEFPCLGNRWWPFAGIVAREQGRDDASLRFISPRGVSHREAVWSLLVSLLYTRGLCWCMRAKQGDFMF